jgi:CheY-like chemotaxis protein
LISEEWFAEHVKEALSGYHDPVRLETNPLVTLLALRPAPGEAAASSLRQLLREAIQALRPAESACATGHKALGFRVLWLRYVEGRSQYTIGAELGLSRASIYRHHQQAVDACTRMLWRKYQEVQSGEQAPGAVEHGGTAHSQAAEEAAKLAREANRQAVLLSALLDSARQIVLPLAEQRGIALQIVAPSEPPTIWGDPAILRQIILNMLTKALRLAAGDRLECTVDVRHGETLWCLEGLAEAPHSRRGGQDLDGFEVSRALLEVYGGRFWLDSGKPGSTTLCFTLPIGRPKSVLIVDDSLDTIRLYQRWLQAHDYAVTWARSAQQMKAQLPENKPDLVLLDVLMPREDGWDMLQYLKAMPETAAIPVVVCSVLDEPGLALALGASEVLHKPILEETLIRAVGSALAQASSRG